MWPMFAGFLFTHTATNVTSALNGPKQRVVGVLLWFAISLTISHFTRGLGDSSNLVATALLLFLMFLVTWRPDRNGLVASLFGGLQLYVILKALFAAFGLLAALSSSAPGSRVWPHLVSTATYAGAVLLVNWRFALDQVRARTGQVDAPSSGASL